MKLTTLSRIEFEVDPSAYLHSPHDRENLHYLFDRLWSGEEVAEQNFEVYGIKVRLVDEFISIPRLED
jgi:hypothetical protein